MSPPYHRAATALCKRLRQAKSTWAALEPEECGENETCAAGVCRADMAPAHECTTEGAECADGMACIRGMCRMPCAAPVNCSEQGPMTECVEGYCLSPREVESVSERFDDCADGASCINGQCVSADY